MRQQFKLMPENSDVPLWLKNNMAFINTDGNFQKYAEVSWHIILNLPTICYIKALIVGLLGRIRRNGRWLWWWRWSAWYYLKILSYWIMHILSQILGLCGLGEGSDEKRRRKSIMLSSFANLAEEAKKEQQRSLRVSFC